MSSNQANLEDSDDTLVKISDIIPSKFRSLFKYEKLNAMQSILLPQIMHSDVSLCQCREILFFSIKTAYSIKCLNRSTWLWQRQLVLEKLLFMSQQQLDSCSQKQRRISNAYLLRQIRRSVSKDVQSGKRVSVGLASGKLPPDRSCYYFSLQNSYF